MSILEGFRFAWAKNQDYAPKLVADLSDEQMILQAAPAGKTPANHPAWVLSHLNVYLPVISAIIDGRDFEDPREHRFGLLSKPESGTGIYPARDELVAEFVAGHQKIDQQLAQADISIFDQAISLPRWAEVIPTAAVALPYLMFNHENLHLGQVSAWRRLQGLPSV